MCPITIKQLAVFESPPQAVFDALTDERRHSAFTGNKASIDARAGGHFSAYDGYITGVFIEVIPSKKFVQEWRASDWPAGASSTVTVELERKRGQTLLYFTQEGVPDEFAEAISQGWHDFYWDRLREYLEKTPG
jgi:activator of HSP90 ATPase